MENNKEIENKLKEAVRITMDPGANQTDRLQAYEFIENIQEDVGLAVPFGFQLCQCDNAAAVRHFGLRLIENAIKYHWNNISLQQKTFIKDNTMNLLAAGTKNILSEELYIKDKVSRLVVEMIKREWPQHWPSLLDELHKIACVGATQTELVLLVFIRLSEDIATLKTIENASRSKDIYQALNRNMESIFNFFFDLLEKYHFSYTTKENLQPGESCRIIQVLFMTLVNFLEWVSLPPLKSYLEKLTVAISNLLLDPNLRMCAAECLLQLVSRKVDGNCSSYFFAERILKALCDIAIDCTDYPLLKSVSQVLCAMCSFISTKINKKEIECPLNFPLFLRVLLGYTNHHSLYISGSLFSSWNIILSMEMYKDFFNPQQVLSPLMETAFNKIRKHGFPSDKDEASVFSEMDFGSDAEFETYFHSQKVETLKTVRLVALLSPDIFYTYLHEYAVRCLQIPPLQASFSNDKKRNRSFAPLIEWERIASIIDGVIPKVPEVRNYKPTLAKNLELVCACLEYNCQDPNILSSLLYCLSGLSTYLPLIPSAIPLFLDKIFSSVTLQIPGQTKEGRCRILKNVRKHAAALLIKLATSYPDLMMPHFASLDETIDKLYNLPDELSILEKVTLDQARLILNCQGTYNDKQLIYINKIIAPASKQWTDIKEKINSPQILMESLGLTKEPPLIGQFDPCGDNRSALYYCLSIFNAVVRRCYCLKEANGRCPVFGIIEPYLPIVFCLFRSHNGLWLPEAISALSSSYSKVYATPSQHKKELLSLHSRELQHNSESPQDRSAVDRMRGFFLSFTETLNLFVGNLGQYMGEDYYKLPHLSDYVIHSALHNLKNMPDYRLKIILRQFLKPFIFFCPEECLQPVILPILNHLCPIMRDHLDARWCHVKSLLESGHYDPDSTDLDEMFDDFVLRLLTREYIDILKIIFLKKNYSTKVEQTGENDQLELDVEMESIEEVELGPLGRFVILCDSLCYSVITTLLKALSWPDSSCCRKSWSPLLKIVRGMIQESPQFLNEEAVKQIIVSAIWGLHYHGQHADILTDLCGFGCSLYGLFRPHFPGIREILLQLPNVSVKDVDELDKYILNTSQNENQKKLDKLRKSAFKKAINEMIGKSIGETFKKDIRIKTLPPMFRSKRPRQLLLEESQDLSLFTLFDDHIAL